MPSNPTPVHLTSSEKEWLVKLVTSSGKRLSLLIDAPPKRAMNGWVKKRFATDIMGTFWALTELGQQRGSLPPVNSRSRAALPNVRF